MEGVSDCGSLHATSSRAASRDRTAALRDAFMKLDLAAWEEVGECRLEGSTSTSTAVVAATFLMSDSGERARTNEVSSATHVVGSASDGWAS